MEYNFSEIEKKWQQYWQDNQLYKVSNETSKPKYYVLDMFPYPSGAGLHVGHPLGYIASDIFARYKRLKGFNVLHPMGYDAFGLPAEQYAIDHGIHPAVSTAANIKTFRSQLDKIGFSFDWSREVNTSQPQYYKWTQWIFLQLFNSWYNRNTQKAESITQLVKLFETQGSSALGIRPLAFSFTAEEWKKFTEKQQQDILMEYRLAYCSYGEVNWCEALGTVLANDEVVNGVSERGGHPVVKKKLRQWYLRITEYADRLLTGLQQVDFSDAMKEMQTNWIGKSSGAEIEFALTPNPSPEGEGNTPPKVDNAKNYENAKRMRKEPTEAESILWQALRDRNIEYKFRRQHPLGSFILDFVSLEIKLCIEVDGGYHNTAEQKEEDKARDEELNTYGFKVLRFTNEEVVHNLSLVLTKIKQTANERKENLTTIEDALPSPVGEGQGVRVYTTRPDTIFGVDFMVIAPEHELVKTITTEAQKQAVEEYLDYVNSRSERERISEKKISGVFTGSYAINPFDGRKIPVWISEYVLAGYGTGAIMAVPCGDERDYRFAKHFNIPITNIIGDAFNGEDANPTKEAILQNSGFLNGLVMKDAMEVAINKLEELGIGKRKVNFKMRDAAFSRQRYWGEPFPIKWENGIAYPLGESELPITLPDVESYKPGPDGEGPLANIEEWISQNLETNTMPGYAGSSWYFLRYMDPKNENSFADRKITDYWNQVDLYVGGTEHAVGHLLYSRMWTKVLYDLGHIGFDEPFKKLLNQGMIQGVSKMYLRARINFISKYEYVNDIFKKYELIVSKNILSDFIKPEIAIEWIKQNHIYEFKNADLKLNQLTGEAIESIIIEPIRVDINKYVVDDTWLDTDKYVKEKEGNKRFIFFWERSERKGNNISYFYDAYNGLITCISEVEKMSKSKFNTVNPDDLVVKYGADTFRMYEMFLGPVEMSKPWETKGIEGVHRFIKKLWRLFFDEMKGKVWTTEKATAAELKILHNTIRKVETDTERFSFNTCISHFMIAVNELSDLKCHKQEVLEPLVVLLAPYAPHIAEELYQTLTNGEKGSVLDAAFPAFNEEYIKESSKEYPISVNGKLRDTMVLALDLSQEEVEKLVLENEKVQKWLDGKPPKKIIYVKNKMVNVVV